MQSGHTVYIVCTTMLVLKIMHYSVTYQHINSLKKFVALQHIIKLIASMR